MTRKRSIAGETLVESLVGMMVVALVFVFLVNAIVTAARINNSVQNTDVSFDIEKSTKVGTIEVTINNDSNNSVDVDLYKVGTETGDTRYYYYERQ